MTKTLNISDEDKALLTAEELAGMVEGEEFDESSETEEAAAAAAAEDKTGADATGTDAEAAGKTNDDAAGTAADDNGAAAAASTDTNAADDAGAAASTAGDVSFASVPPVPVSKLPDDYEDKVKAVATDKKALAEQLDEGDITMAEYHDKLDGLNRTERELERTKDRVADNEHRRYETWTNIHVIGFMKQHPEYKNEMLTGLLDQEVRKMQAAGTYSSDTDPQILVEAHKKIAASFPGTFSEPAKPAASGKKDEKKPVVHNTAPSLAKVPAANVDQPGEGEFSSLDRLLETDPLGWERACERLSKSDPAKYEQYLAQ